MEKLLTLKETAKILRVSERTIMRYLKSGKLKASKLGQWRIQESDLKKFLKENLNLKSCKRYAKSTHL
jgi:excisionase family DNA binding protein